MRLRLLLTGLLLGSAITAFADDSSVPLNMQHRFYVGGITGYGNTDWSQLVAQDNETSQATPVSASGSGAIIGALIGYQLTPYIAIEAQYIHYPDSSISFMPGNAVYSNITNFNSVTNYYAITPKVIMPLDNDHYEVFGTLGAALVTRSDVLAHISNYRPTFGFGASDNLSSHWTVSLAFNYTPGTGVAAINASSQYIPYLYAGEVILAYRI